MGWGEKILAPHTKPVYNKQEITEEGCAVGMEFELKYRLTEQVLETVRQEIAGHWEQISMETTYYDTPSGALAQKRYTLRTRLENGVAVSTVKTPGTGACRGEWEVEEGDILQAIPKLCKLGGPEELLLLTQAGVIAVCGARFVRQICPVTCGQTRLELALDRGILFGGEKQLPFWELEVELKQGTQEDACAFAEELAQKYGLQPEPKSKFQRAKALREER